MPAIVARCGQRCDLCPAFRDNLHGLADQQAVSDLWFEHYGFRIPPESIHCDGCRDERPEAHRIDDTCPVRLCGLTAGSHTCRECGATRCSRFENRTVSLAWIEASHTALSGCVPPT